MPSRAWAPHGGNRLRILSDATLPRRLKVAPFTRRLGSGPVEKNASGFWPAHSASRCCPRSAAHVPPRSAAVERNEVVIPNPPLKLPSPTSEMPIQIAHP
jgi:hypothetical protein